MKKFIIKYSKKPEDLFKKLFFTFFAGYFPFAILHVILNLMGILPVDFNNEPIYGIKGAIVIVLFMPFIVFMLSFFVWIYYIIGNFILRIILKIFYE